ncbi:carbamoyl phosphate synthase-like protein [Campylobacter hyointestinalis subsp. lawsonii CCUG 27631]|uniref:ATP-grasp domain-containing protein n=1 Tax=Campylobacter hyointestinalis TaxID=198 RepID=UPI0007C95406|nr:ATP-grasp domain-containing protein [Campylobacter hyointestinalis]ANE33469.1 carbamoyl phosphate synthase-like protein [Campylobacter hyointestinalis subsp. lawsonii CCUG 27631]
MRKINVLVTGIGGGSHGEQIVKALKLATKIDLTIIGTDVTDITTGKRLVDIFYKVPYANADNYKEVLAEIIKKHDIKFIFHGSEPELKFISENRDFFEELNVSHPLNSKDIITLCMNKYETFKVLERLGVKIGKYKKIDFLEDIKEIDFFPLVLKPSTGSGGSAHVNICFDKEDLEMATKYMLKYGVDIVAQEYIYSENEYTIGVSSDENSEIIGSIGIKRILGNSLSTRVKIKKDDKLYMISTGISQGEIIKDRDILSQAEEIAKKLNSVGPLNIQCRIIEGIIYPFEINPRLSGTTSLRAIAGYNEPEAMILNKVLKKEVDLINYQEKIILRTIEEVEVYEK